MVSDVALLDVLLHDVPIGTLTRFGGDRTLFAFNDTYIADEDRAVLGLRFKDQFGELITEFKPVNKRVMRFFSNLLPEGHMRTYLAERAGVNPEREFFLLWVLGSDLPGAIKIQPADDEPWPTDHPYDGTRGELDLHANALRFSLAGVQLKFSALANAQGGLTIPLTGVGGSWIAKLPSLRFDGIPENEYAMMVLARQLGMDVPALKLVGVDEIVGLPDGIGGLKGQALAIERFDRLPDGSAEHIEDFAQVFDAYPEDKYKKGSARSIARVIGAEGSSDDIAEFIRRLTFNMLIGNADMHLKNWSLIYPDKRHAALAPAYDFISTIVFIPDEEAALKVSRTRRFDGFSEGELSHLADNAHLPQKLVLDTAYETVELFHQRWQDEKAHLTLTREMVAAIESHLKTVPIANA